MASPSKPTAAAPGLSPTDTPPPPDRGFGPALLWAAFLGASWTWVIGMLFPVLLLRDYGPLGWLVFAVPNVVGAAAMGFVLPRPRVSLELVRRHAGACRAFSVVTLAFHLYVVSWLLTPALGLGAAMLLIAALGIFVGLGMRAGTRGALLIALGVMLMSLGVLSNMLQLPEAWISVKAAEDPAVREALAPRLGLVDLAFFGMAAAMGFMCCPYLDLTFHQARQHTDAPTGKAAFTLGFGGMFLSMILLTLVYGGSLIPLFTGGPLNVSNAWKVLLAIHLALQIAFTVFVHARAFFDHAAPSSPAKLAAASFAALMLGVLARGMGDLMVPTAMGDMTYGEIGYRGFLLLYGSVFPAYAVLKMLPDGWSRPGARAVTTRGNVAPPAIALHHAPEPLRNRVFMVAAPVCYAFSVGAFVVGYSWLCLLAVVVVLAGKAWLMVKCDND